jgi:para-nitrobenzyl esterase
MKKIILCLASLIILLTAAYSQNKRYLDVIFPQVDITKNIKYGQNYDFMHNMTDLYLDFYQPGNDNSTMRPLVIFIHGGAFLSGSKDSDYVTIYSNNLAKRGYVTASINYRLGVEGLSLNAFGRALYRAIQDSKAAVRFFRANASTYGIDTSNIYIGGYSAGAITVIHYSYMTAAEISTICDTSGLGPLDNSSGNPGYSNNVKGIISQAGAIYDSTWIHAGSLPVILFHGNADATVPYGDGYALGLIHMYGSQVIDRIAKRLCISSELYTFNGMDHTLPTDTVQENIILDSITNSTSRFLFSLITQTSNDVSDLHLNKFDLNIYPNPVVDNGIIHFASVDYGNIKVSLFDFSGNSIADIYSGCLSADIHEILLLINYLSKGVYFIKLNIGNKIFTKKILKN